MPNTPSFQRPPVIEVSFGVQFGRIAKWQTSHFGDYWSRVRAEFPGTGDAPPVELITPSSPPVEVLILPPLRRVIFFSSDQSRLLQVQDNRFHFNWRKVRSDDAYPRYAALFPEFGKWLESFRAFLADRGLGEDKHSRFELTYVNHIDVSGDVSSSVERYVRPFNWSSVSPQYLSRPRTVTGAWQFEMKDNCGEMTANLTHVKTRDNKELLVLALSCSGQADERMPFEHWFDVAHKSIVFGFKDLTTETGHEFWGLEK